MIPASTAAASARPEAWTARIRGANDAAWRALVLLSSIAFAIGWTVLPGKTFHWDAINYHFYLGFAALNDRFGLDFFAAGTPSYINPYVYIPLHLLERAAVPGAVAATIIAAVHALILWLTYELALALTPQSSAPRREWFAALAVLLAALSPVFLQGLGLTLVDIPLGAFVVGGWAAIAISLRRPDLRWVACGGIFCGIAAALKLSNALYAVAAVAMLAFFPGGWRCRLLGAATYCVACSLVFLAVSAPWSLRLWEEFGNPLFPLLNDVFKSPDFTSAPLHYERFRPANWQQFLLRPFDMLSPLSRQHTEGHAPDLRFAALFVTLAAACMAVMLRARSNPSVTQTSDERDSTRVLVAVSIAFIVAWCLWLKASGNSRYFIPMGCVGAALLAALLQRAYWRWKDRAAVIIVLLVLAQAMQTVVASDWKREGVSWDGPLLEAKYPDRFRDEPYLFLSTSFLSGSAFLSHWHPQSGMMTISGFYSLGPDRPGWQRARGLIERNAGRLRSLTPLPKQYDETTGLPGSAADLDVYVRRFGLAIDPHDCEFVKLKSNLRDASSPIEPRSAWTTWVSCRLRPDPAGAERYARAVAEVEAVFDRVESVCPNLFHPPRPVTEQLPKWTRLYNMGSEVQLWIADGRLLYFSPLIGGDPIDIGSVSDWSKGPQPIDCSKKSAPAFGGLVQ